MKTFSRREAAALLWISESTLTRRLKLGKYTCTRTGEGQYAPSRFSYADIGLVEPTPEPTPTTTLTPTPTTTPTRTLAPVVEPREPTQAELDEQYAADYKAGLVSDSLGNYIHSTTVNLLGAVGKRMPVKRREPEIVHAGSVHPDNPVESLRTVQLADVAEPRQAFLNAIFSDIHRGFSR